MPAPRPHTQGMTNQYSTSSAPTLRLLCSISGGTNRAHWEDVTENTPLTFVNDCVSFTTTVSARYWLIDCRHIEDATKMATELYREAIHVPFMAKFVVYAKRTDECQAQLRMFCVTDDKEDKALERIERFIQVAKSRDVEVHEGKPIYLEFGGNLVPVAKSGEQLSIPFRAFRENRVAFPVMIKTQDLEPICRCQFMRDPKVPKGEPSPTPIAILNIMVPDDMPVERISPQLTDTEIPRRTEEQELIWRQRLSDPRLEDICNLLGKDWVALAYELGVSVATVNQIQAKRITAAEQAQLMLKLWKTQSGTKAQDTCLELALCRIGRDDIIAPQSDVTNERRIQRNIYQERQASEEIEAYKAEEDNKLKDKLYDENHIEEHLTRDLEQDHEDEAKYSPEEKSIIEKSEIERTPTPSEDSEEDEDTVEEEKEIEIHREEILEIKKEEPKIIERSQEQFRKFDPTSPAKPTPKHLQRHMRNESMRFPSGDFSNVTITPRKSVSETTETKHILTEKTDSFTNEIISQKEIVSSRVEEKLDDGDHSPDLVVEDDKDIAEAPLKEKISSFESKILKEPSMELPKTTVKLTKEALKKHTMEQDQAVEYTQEFVREQSKQISTTETQEHIVQKEMTEQTDISKSVKETIQQFDSKIKEEDKSKTLSKTVRTDSTLVQVSSEEDSEFLKKSTDSETETESKTTIKGDQLEQKSKFKLDMKSNIQESFEHKIKEEKPNGKQDKKSDDDQKKDDQALVIKFEKQMTEELRTKVSEEEIMEALEEKDVSISEKMKEKIETQLSIASTKSDLSKHTKTDSMSSDVQDLIARKISQESPILSGIDKADSLADLQQSTEKDFSFISQTESKVYSKDSKHRGDSLDEASQFSDLEDQIGTSPAQKPSQDEGIENVLPSNTKVKNISMDISGRANTRDQTLEFLKYENEYSAQINAPLVAAISTEKVSPKDSPVISAKARQFIETVPEDDSVQECFFSKRIYSDSLEDSEHTDSRRHSEADSLKSDQSDVKAKVSSSDFDERAEYEETVDSGSGFGDEKFEESIGFTSMRIESQSLEKQDSESDKEPELIFKKMTPKRHSRTESVSITKLSDLQNDIETPKLKQEFHIFVTEAEEIDKSFEKDEGSDKISSESSREIEISERKSSEGISDKISSEDAVTEKKTSSEEDALKEKDQVLDDDKDRTESIMKEVFKEMEKVDTKLYKEDTVEKVDASKRQSVTSAGSGSVTELRLEEKRLSDAYSLTESRDYTFEESEDDIGTQGTHVDVSKERVEIKFETDKTKIGKSSDSKLAKLTHGDSLDDVEGFPEDHVTDYVHKLPQITEVGSVQDKEIVNEFLSREREEQLKRETAIITPKSVEASPSKILKVSQIKTVSNAEDQSSEIIETNIMKKDIISSVESSSKFDVTKLRTDTLGKFNLEDEHEETKRYVPKDLDLKEVPEITKEQVKPVIDDILQKGTIVAAARSPILEKDMKIVTKDIMESERRSYDAKVPHKEERRHSCISPAISLERIAESEVESEEEELPKSMEIVPETRIITEISNEMKKSDSAMKQMADNIEIIIKQASEDIDGSSEEQIIEPAEIQDISGQVSVDSIIEEAVTTVEKFFESPNDAKEMEIETKKEVVYEETKKFAKDRPGLIKSLSRDSGEIVIMPKKKHPRTFSVQSSPDEVEEQIYTDSESDMDKAKVLEIIEPGSDLDGKIAVSSFDPRKLRTDSLDDADDFPEKENEYFEEDEKYTNAPGTKLKENAEITYSVAPSSSGAQIDTEDDKSSDKLPKKTHFVDRILHTDLVSKSTTESSVTTVVSTLTKSSDEDQKSILEEGTSTELSKLSGAELIKDPSKTSMDAKEDPKVEEPVEDRGTPDLSKKSVDLTKDYSKSSIDSKDTSRDFATNELSKDSTVDLTKDYSKASVESVKETSKSIDEKTFSEDHSSLEVSKTLASDVSDGITISRDFLEEERSVSRIVKVSSSSSQETSVMTESKLLSDHEYLDKTRTLETQSERDFIGEIDERIAELKSEFKKEDIVQESSKQDLSALDKHVEEKTDDQEVENEVPDMSELNRRCSNLLEDISQGALIRIDSTHVTHDLTSKFSKTPPPSPVDLHLKDKSKLEESTGDKHTGLQLKGTDSSFLDASRQSPRASSAGDSLISETEAHQSDILTEASKVLTEAARPKSPTKHIADNLSFINVDQPTLTSGAIELVDRTIEKSIDVIDQIKKEQLAVKMEEMQKSMTSDTFFAGSRVETSTSSSSVHKTFEGSELKFQSIDPQAVISDMVAKFGSTEEYSTILSHKETETRKISGQEYFSETKQVSSSDDDSLIIKTETTHELRGQEHETKEKTTLRREGDQTETSLKKLEKAHEASAKRSDVETKTVSKSTDDTDIVKVEREFLEQGLYTGRQTKSEERMTALKDDTVKKKHEVKISERELSHEQWGKEYFTEPGELEDIREDEDSKSRTAFIDSSLKIVEKDERVSCVEVSAKGKLISSKIEHHKEESIIESKEHDDLSSDVSHATSFKSETVERRGSSESSPKSKSKSFKKDDEVYEVDFIKEIKVSTSPIKSTFSRTGSQDTQSESEIAPDLPHDDKTNETPKKEKFAKSPVKLPLQQLQDQVWEVSLQKTDSFEMADDFIKSPKLKTTTSETTSITTKSSDSDGGEVQTVMDTKLDVIAKTLKSDMSPSTLEISDDMSIASKDIMIKSGESIDTECMIKSLESHEGEALQKSIDSTMSAETLHASEFSTEVDSAFLTGTATDRKEEVKLVKEKSLEDICSSGYDTDLSSAEFHATKLESERVDFDSLMSAQPLADLSVLEKTIDEVKQSLEAAQVEIISEKSDGSSKYKQSPSEFQFKLLISPDRPEVITEEPLYSDDHIDKAISDSAVAEKHLDSQKSDSVSQKISSQDETTISDEEKDTVHIKESSVPLDGADISIKSDSGPHSILETESEIILSDRDCSSIGSPEVKLRVQKHIKSKLGVVERRSASEVEGWSSSGESHYHSFDHTESRPLSSDVEVMMTAQSATEFDTALTSHDVSSQSLRTSKDYYTAASSLTSRDSMKSLDSDGSSHVASIDISDASETLVPSANELKEELMESSTYVEQFLQEGEKGQSLKVKDVSDEEVSGDEEEPKGELIDEPVGKMKRSHEMRFQPKDMIPEHFPLESMSENVEAEEDSSKEKDGSDTTISSQLKTDENLSSSISKLDLPSSQSVLEIEKKTKSEDNIKSSFHEVQAKPFSITKIEKPERQFVDIESEIIPVGSEEYEEIVKHGTLTAKSLKSPKEEKSIIKTSVYSAEQVPSSRFSEEKLNEVTEQCTKKIVKEVSVIPFPITEIPPSKREFVDVEAEIIFEGSSQYEEILKSKSDSSVPKTKTEKSIAKTPESQLESKQSSTSSLKTHEHLSTPQTPLSAPSQSSLSTDNGREYVLDDMYDISETPELRSDLVTENSKSELVVTTEERAMHSYEKEQESPTSDEFEMVDKPSEMDDFVVIEEVAKEAQETDTEGKSVQIKSQKYIKKHDTEVEEYLSKASKKQESTSSGTSGSLSDEELLQYEIEQKRLQAQELAEIEAGKRWIQMQFEGDPRYDYERIPLEDIKEEEMTDFDASRIGSLSSQKESIGSFGSFRNSYGSLSESEMASRIRFRVKGENDDISISSLQEFENLEKALMEQYQQYSSSSQDSLNGSLPRRYILSRSQGDDISISSLKEFEGLETACLEALRAEILAKQKEALLLADPKEVSGSFLEREKRSYSGSSESSPPQKGGSPSQKSGSPSQKGGSPSQKLGSYGSPSQKLLTDSASIRKLIDQQMALEQKLQEQITPKVITVKKFDDRGAFFVPEPDPEKESEIKPCEVTEECIKTSSFVCAAAPSDGSAESIPGDCEEMMKILDQEEKSKQSQIVTRTITDGGTIEVVRTTTVIQQKFVDGKKVSETVTSTDGDGAVDIPSKPQRFDEISQMSVGSEMSSSIVSQSSEMDSIMTVLDRHTSDGETVTVTKHTIIMSSEKPEDLEFSRESSTVRELSPSSGRSIAHGIIALSGKHFTDPASGSWSGQDEELSSSGSFSR
ncbi:unnamed protein product [Diatraea saccharalis]|uniref:Death domain-containing protein n=1 Tax=Diatraea saccharalis TaxID=40085 RepID=A0A9N9WLX0_9NEOP|nr:unnamed protein product [Diatraea saccharalis]